MRRKLTVLVILAVICVLIYFGMSVRKTPINKTKIEEEQLPTEDIKKRYEELNEWLDEKLSEWKPEKLKPMMFNAHHILASESLVAYTPDNVKKEFLDMLLGLNPDTISFYIYPENYEKYKEEYDYLFSKVKNNGKKLIIGYMVSSNTFEHPPTFNEYLNKELEYLQIYVQRWNPDYIAVFIEPTSMQKRINAQFTEDEWIELADKTTKLVKQTNPNVKTIVVFTVGEFLQSDAPFRVLNISTLDVIGVNIYSWKINFRRLGERIDKIKTKKEVWIWETWWSTQKNTETGKQYPWFRDCYWQDINSKWIRVMTYFAQNHNIKMISPFFTEQFVYCNNKYNPWPNEKEQFQEIINAVLNKNRTQTYYTYKTIIKETSNTSNTFLNLKVAINYNFIAHIPENRTYEDAAKIIKDLNADFLSRAYNDNSGPMPESSELDEAVREFKNCNIPNAENIASMYIRYGRTWEQFKKIVNSVKKENPDIIFEVCLHPQYVPKITWDPFTHECIDTKKWALNFGKWGIINPETGKPFTLEETQEFMNKFTGGAPEELNSMWYADISNSEFQEYLVEKTRRYVEFGADAIGFDILFGQLNAVVLILRQNGYSEEEIYKHPAFIDTLKGINNLVKRIKDLEKEYKRKVYVGSWGSFLVYPEEVEVPKFDYIYLTPTSEEVKHISFEKEKWEKVVQLAKERLGNDVLIMSFMDNGGLDNYPMHVFSQELSRKEQMEFLEKWDNFMRSLGIIPVYPVQDGVMGRTVKKLSYGKYNKFDALAPEFKLYETIKELTKNAK